MNEQHSAGSAATAYCVCGKSQSARRQDGSLYCSGCGKDYHPDNFEDEDTDLCEDCNERPITGLDAQCDVCRENAMNEQQARTSAATFAEKLEKELTPSQVAWYCGYSPCRQLNSAWANTCGRCGHNRPAEANALKRGSSPCP